jgi:hypothetical protein
MQTLSERQQGILRFIEQYIEFSEKRQALPSA